MYIHIKDPVPANEETPHISSQGFQSYIETYGVLTQTLLRIETPRAVHHRIILEVDETAVAIITERMLQPSLDPSVVIEHREEGLGRQPQWKDTAFLYPSETAKPLTPGILGMPGSIELKWTKHGLKARMDIGSQETAAELIEQLAAHGWRVRFLAPPLLPFASIWWNTMRVTKTELVPSMFFAGLQRENLASIHDHDVDVEPFQNNIILEDDEWWHGQPSSSLEIIEDKREEPQGDDSQHVLTTQGDGNAGFLLGVNELGASVRLSWRSMSFGIAAPDAQCNEFVMTMIGRALDWGNKDGCGVIGIVPPSIADLISSESWMGRIRVLDTRNLQESVALPLERIEGQRRRAVLQTYGIDPVDDSFEALLQALQTNGLATPEVIGLLSPPGDALPEVIDANGGIILVCHEGLHPLVIDLLWALCDQEVNNTPLIVTTAEHIPLPSLAQKSLVMVMHPNQPTTVCLTWRSGRWELRDANHKLVTILDGDLHAAQAEAEQEAAIRIHEVLGAGYAGSDSLIPNNIPSKEDVVLHGGNLHHEPAVIGHSYNDERPEALPHKDADVLSIPANLVEEPFPPIVDDEDTHERVDRDGQDRETDTQEQGKEESSMRSRRSWNTQARKRRGRGRQGDQVAENSEQEDIQTEDQEQRTVETGLSLSLIQTAGLYERVANECKRLGDVNTAQVYRDAAYETYAHHVNERQPHHRREETLVDGEREEIEEDEDIFGAIGFLVDVN